GATTVTFAATASNCSSLADATRPPPMSTTARPVRFRNNGNISVISRSATVADNARRKQKRPGKLSLPGLGLLRLLKPDHMVIIDVHMQTIGAGARWEPAQQQQLHMQVA